MNQELASFHREWVKERLPFSWHYYLGHIGKEEIPRLQGFADDISFWLEGVGIPSSTFKFLAWDREVTEREVVFREQANQAWSNDGDSIRAGMDSISSFSNREARPLFVIEADWISYVAVEMAKPLVFDDVTLILRFYKAFLEKKNEYRDYSEVKLYRQALSRLGVVGHVLHESSQIYPDSYAGINETGFWDNFFFPWCEREGIPDFFIPVRHRALRKKRREVIQELFNV